MINHPCLSCGACCAFFRVSFHWSEILTVSHAVPAASTEKISLHTSAMNGTNQKTPRCDRARKGKGLDSLTLSDWTILTT